MLRKIGIQIAGQVAVAILVYYWLGIGVATKAQVALNAGLALVGILALAALDAFGLGNWKNWPWALPAVLLTGAIAYKTWAVFVVALLWLIILLPSAAARGIRVMTSLRYVGTGLAILTLSVVPAIALLLWTPLPESMYVQAFSFAGRVALAACFLFGGWGLLLHYVGEAVRGNTLKVSL